MVKDYTAGIERGIVPCLRVRCVFSQRLNDNSLGFAQGAPPGGRRSGVEEWRAVSRVLQSPGRVARVVLDDLVTTFFPADCGACGGPLLRAGSSSICDGCLSGLREQSMRLCVRCGETLDVDGAWERSPAEGVLCAPCRMVPPEFARATAYAVYEDELRKIVHLLKYEGLRSVAKPLGKLLARVVETLEGEAARELTVVAVPLYPAKQRRRGFNQSELLADSATAELRRTRPEWRLVAAHRALRRVRDTEDQFGLTPPERRKNLRGAFEVVDAEAVAGREVLLLDDIYTTGATARECARVLRRAGASRVWVATVARAQREMVAMWNARDRT
ncbi:ComF family protein [Edaphobacter bradus]|uniref:ComF family protein n=1 Tax=Edaphobacter bradus TaxID=2259016 RepID=UPI00295B4562|nr:ComF family protein [Edaphobacter bradus]